MRRVHSHGPRFSRLASRPVRRPPARCPARRPVRRPPARRPVRLPFRRPSRQAPITAPHPGPLGIARPHTRRRWPRPPAASSDARHPTKPTRAPHHRRKPIPSRCFEPTCRPHQARRRRGGGPRLRRASCRGWCLGIRWPLLRRPRAGLLTKRTRTRSRMKRTRSMRWRR